MVILIARILAVIFVILGLLHVYWAMGGGWGASAAIPEKAGKPLFKPGPAATLAVALLLIAAALVTLGRAHLIHLGMPAVIWRVGIWVLFAVFLVRAIGDFHHVGFFKRNRGTPFARLDSRLFSPLCLVLSLGALVVAVS